MKTPLLKRLAGCWQLYLCMLPALIWIILFCYGPMYGVLMAFKDYKIGLGIMGSPWAGLKYFKMFFESNNFALLIVNTLRISLVCLLFGFPAPIIFALLLKRIRNRRFQGFMRTVTYLPNFISVVVLVSMLSVFFSSDGFMNTIASFFGATETVTYSKEQYFLPIYVISGIWQGLGCNAIIYIAALSGVSPELYEAAEIDGASILKTIRYIDVPMIMPTIIMMLILSVGSIMAVGYEKVLLMQDNLNIMSTEIISTYVYKIGINSTQYSYSTAIGLFNAVINFALLLTANKISKKAADISLF